MELLQPLLLAYLAALIILSFISPRWAILFFFSTKFTMDIFWSSAVVDELNILKITGVLFPLFCIVFLLVKRPAVMPHPLLKLLLALFILNGLAGLWGITNSHLHILPLPHSPLTIKHILDWNLRFLNLASAFLIVPHILGQAMDKLLFFRSFLISTIIPCVISWFQLSTISIDLMIRNVSEPYSVSLFQRLNATYHDSGTLSIVMFTGIILSILLSFIDASRWLKILYILYAFLCSTILYFTFSRTMWICLTLFLVLFSLAQKRYNFTLTITLIAIIIFTLIPLTQKRFERELSWIENGTDLTNYKEIEKLGTGRIWLWNDARKHFLKLDMISKTIGSGGSYGSHNQYIAWLLRNGIIGLTVWLFFLYKTGNLLWIKAKEERTERFIPFILCCFVP